MKKIIRIIKWLFKPTATLGEIAFPKSPPRRVNVSSKANRIPFWMLMVSAFVVGGCSSLNPPDLPDISDEPVPPVEEPTPTEPEPDPPVSTEPPMEWWCKSSECAADWPVVSAITIDNVGGSTFRINLDPPFSTGNNVICGFVFRDGRWVGGGFDGIGESGRKQITKTWGNMKSGISGRNGPESESRNREYVKLRKGEDVLFIAISVTGKTKSNYVIVRYK